MNYLRPFIVVAAVTLAGRAIAGEKTVTLEVRGMYCELCPLTVKKALSRVPGVSNVSASYAKKEAVVTFDDTKASVDTLTKATANAGYPSEPRQ